MIFSLAWNINLFNNFKSSCFEVFGDKGHGIFEPKNWWKYDIYWLLKSSCFNLFGNGKYGLFLSQKVDGNMMFTDYWKVLVLNFSLIFFFESRSWWKDDICWLLRSSCFELFSDGKYGVFFSQKVDGKMIITWSFRAFYDIPGPGKYGFSRSVRFLIIIRIINIICITMATKKADMNVTFLKSLMW